jgi:hypothetical protein
MPNRLILSLCLLLLAALRVAAQPVGAPIFPISELKPGTRGEVWTVFKGNQSEPFEVQVTGVLHNALGPGKNMILCELIDPRVQAMGAVAGMSGSPLYIDGKIVGVLAYQIQRFETVRYAGFTPITDMLEISALPADPLGNPMRPTPLPLSDEAASRRDSAPINRDIQPLSPAFSIGGLSPNVAALFSTQFQELGLAVNALGGSLANANAASSTSTTVPTPTELRPGDVVAVALATGDVSLAGTGTVSHVDGSRILAFGHPMLSLGATDLPMAAAEIVTILPSQLNSIKVSNTGAIIGAFTQDRLSGIYGELGKQAPMVPVEVSFPARMNRNSLRFDVVRHEQLLPTIAATGLAQAVMGSNESGLSRGFKVTTTVDFPGAEPVQLNQIYAGPQGFQQGINEFVTNLSLWIFNPYERVFPERIRFSIENTPEIPQGVIEQMQVSRTSIAPGERVSVTIGWRGFQREARSETFTLDVPRSWAGKELEVVLTTGPALDEMTGKPRSVPIAQMRSFDEYISALRALRESDGLYLAVVERTRLMTDQRATTAEMPGSLERIARAADEARFQRRDSFAPLWEQRVLPGRLFNIQVRKPLAITD